MTTAEKILATVRELTPEQQAEVLDFAASLRHRAEGACEPVPAGLPPLPVLEGRIPAGWKDVIHAPR